MPKNKNEKPGNSHEPKFTEKDLQEIEIMAGLGMRYEDIAAIKGVSDDTLKKYALSCLKRGKAKAKVQVMQTAFRLAISGQTPSMTRFWLRTQANWKDSSGNMESIEVNLNSLVERINQAERPTQEV